MPCNELAENANYVQSTDRTADVAGGDAAVQRW